MTHTLLVIGAGREAIPAIQRAKQLGCFVVATDGNPDAPGFPSCDDHLVVSTYDVGGTVAMARHYDAYSRCVDGVIALAADVPQTVARVAQMLRLPGISTDTAYLTSQKYAMKKCLQRAGVPIPWFGRVESVGKLQQIVHERGYPLVLKPVDSRGARGVLLLRERCGAYVNLAWAFGYAQSQSPTRRVMVEEYLAGPQISTESVMLPDGAVTPGFVDRNYSRLEEFAPHMIEDGGSQPSVLSAEDRQAVCTVAERAAYALGITWGTAKGDMVLTSGGPKVIEMAARLSGGYMSSVQVPMATGVDLVGIAIRLALGDAVSEEEATPQRHQGCAIRYVWPPPGRVVEIYGVMKALKMPCVEQVEMFVTVGDVLPLPTDHTQRAGCVICQATTREAAITQAETAVRAIHVETESI